MKKAVNKENLTQYEMCDEAKVFDNVIAWIASHNFIAVWVLTKQHVYSTWDILGSR